MQFADLDVNMWFDNSPKLFDIMSGYTPCSSMNQASMSDYCWDQSLPSLAQMSDIGAAMSADVIMARVSGASESRTNTVSAGVVTGRRRPSSCRRS